MDNSEKNKAVEAHRKLIMRAAIAGARTCRIVLSDFDMDDMVSDATAHLLTYALDKFDVSKSKLTTFMYEVVYRRTVGTLREQKNHASYSTVADSFTAAPSKFTNDGNVSESDACAHQVSGSDGRDGDSITAERAIGSIERVLSTLPERERDIFTSMVEDDSQDNAVRLARKWSLGHVPAGTPADKVGWFLARSIRTLVSRIRAELRKLLEAEPVTE